MPGSSGEPVGARAASAAEVSTFGVRLRGLRRQAGLSREQLAERTGLSGTSQINHTHRACTEPRSQLAKHSSGYPLRVRMPMVSCSLTWHRCVTRAWSPRRSPGPWSCAKWVAAPSSSSCGTCATDKRCCCSTTSSTCWPRGRCWRSSWPTAPR
ncbi:MAG: helix-turn-helix domain-containing protein [Chloroflexi bacterium]|nr:helix-turn-helix domain-containing protein [Chloroflexota bacterium]